MDIIKKKIHLWVARCLFIALAGLFLTACNSDSQVPNDTGNSGQGTDPIVKLEMQLKGNSKLSILQGRTTSFIAKATLKSGKTEDVTSKATWTSTDDTVLQHTGNGQFTGVAAGDSQVSVSYGGVNSPSKTVRVDSAELIKINISAKYNSAPLGLPVQLTVTGTYRVTDSNVSETHQITQGIDWKVTENNAGISVSPQGLLTSTQEGSATVTATVTANNKTLNDTYEMKISPATLKSIKINVDNISIPTGTPTQVQLTAIDTSDKPYSVTEAIQWQLMDNTISDGVSFDNTKITGNIKGEYHAYATIIHNGQPITDINGEVVKSNTITITVTDATISYLTIQVDPELHPGVGNQAAIYAHYSDNSDPQKLPTQNFVWQSENSSIAEVSSTGLIHSRERAGSTVITATLHNQQNTCLDGSSQSVNCAAVTVTNNLEGLTNLEILMDSKKDVFLTNQEQPFKVFGQFKEGQAIDVTQAAKLSLNGGSANQGTKIIKQSDGTYYIISDKEGSISLQARLGQTTFAITLYAYDPKNIDPSDIYFNFKKFEIVKEASIQLHAFVDVNIPGLKTKTKIDITDAGKWSLEKNSPGSHYVTISETGLLTAGSQATETSQPLNVVFTPKSLKLPTEVQTFVVVLPGECVKLTVDNKAWYAFHIEPNQTCNGSPSSVYSAGVGNTASIWLPAKTEFTINPVWGRKVSKTMGETDQRYTCTGITTYPRCTLNSQ